MPFLFIAKFRKMEASGNLYSVVWIEWGAVGAGKGAKQDCIILCLTGPEPWKRLEQLLGLLFRIAVEQTPLLPQHTTCANSTKQLSCPPSVPVRWCHWFPLFLWHWSERREIETLQSLSCSLSPTPPAFFHSVNLQKNKFWVIFNLFLMFFISRPCSSQLHGASSQEESKYFQMCKALFQVVVLSS